MAPLTSNGASRVAGAHASRAGSTARDIVKKRDKPYKTEKQKVLAKKRKLDLHTSYQQGLPPGYIFLPVGTPELADRCKELSRQRGLPVNVVNAKPVSKFAHNPKKVSFHIARVGYHFKADIVDQAAEELGYIFHRGNFVKEADLAAKRQAAVQQSQFAATLAKYGIAPDLLKQNAVKETPEQVGAAIKELFPRIPDQDLHEIVRHAWKEGTERVGNNPLLDLPRRVQLATIARVRHTYTDYDRLLRAFDWKDARAMVEQGCLQKLVEWRGEDDDAAGGDDDQFEEIVRETIVIDSDDEAAADANEADDEDSMTELEAGDTSDTSIEITHQVAADDLGAESSNESSRRLLDRFRPRHRGVDARKALMKQRIETARQRMRDGVPAENMLPKQQIPFTQPQIQPLAPPPVEVGGRLVYPDQHGRYPEEIVVNGTRLVLERANMEQPAAQHRPLPPQPYQPPPQTSFSAAHSRPPAPLIYGSAAAPSTRHLGPGSSLTALHDRPVASIERDDGLAPPSRSRVAANGSRPAAPDSDRRIKRCRADEPLPAPSFNPQCYDQSSAPRAPVAPRPELVDLVSPDRGSSGTRMNPLTLDGASYHDNGPSISRLYGSATTYARPYDAPSPHTTRNGAPRDPVPYDPSQPLFPANDPQRLPVRTMPPQYQQGQPTANQPAQAYHDAYNAARYGPASQIPQPNPQPPRQQAAQYPPGFAYDGHGHGSPPAARYLVHGAPAPVQQAPACQPFFTQPYAAPVAAGLTDENTRHLHNSAPAPTQYYYSR